MEVLMQLSGNQVDMVGLLIYSSRHVSTFVLGGIITHPIVSVVFYLIDGYTKLGVRLRIAEDAFQMGTLLGGQVILFIPPKMFGMVFGLEEGWVNLMEISIGSQLHGITKEWEIQVGTEVKR